MKKIILGLLCLPLLALAQGGVALDRWPGSVADPSSLQNGARVFSNSCQSCHGAVHVQSRRLRELGLNDQQVRDFAERPAEPVRAKIAAEGLKQAYGAVPPDLTLVARGRTAQAGSGADWLYTYLRSFYRDEKRPGGWNNLVLENTVMPHMLMESQGVQVRDGERLKLVEPGRLSSAEFDREVSDLVGFMVWMAEPEKNFRQQLGLAVLGVLVVLLILAWALKKEYWKNIH